MNRDAGSFAGVAVVDKNVGDVIGVVADEVAGTRCKGDKTAVVADVGAKTAGGNEGGGVCVAVTDIDNTLVTRKPTATMDKGDKTAVAADAGFISIGADLDAMNIAN